MERTVVAEPCEDRVLVGVGDGTTEIRRSDGARAGAADLAVGRPVSVWFGPVMLRSCPGQTSAVAIVLR